MQVLLWERKLLADMLFQERLNFTKCERVKETIRYAFAVWKATNPELHFVDVTERCAAENLWVPMSDSECSESDYCIDFENGTDWKSQATPLDNPSLSPVLCSHRTCFKCQRAQVIVGGFTQKNRRLGDQHVAARVVRADPTNMRPLSTNRKAGSGGTISSGYLEFNVDDDYKYAAEDKGSGGEERMVPNCWRIDSDFCDALIKNTNNARNIDTPSDMLALITGLFWFFFSLCACACICGCLAFLQRLASNLLTGWDIDQDGKLELQEVVYVLDEFCGEVCFECRCPSIHQRTMSRLAGCLSVLETITDTSLTIPLLVVASLLGMPIIYFQEVEACYTCKDFRSVAVHEVGHLLSLDHPAPLFEPTKYRSTLSYRASGIAASNGSCFDLDSEQNVELLTPTVADAKSLSFSDSVMLEFHPLLEEVPEPGEVRHKLDQDDQDGVNFLYPACGNKLPTPGAGLYNPRQYMVWIRLFEEWGKMMLIPIAVLLGVKLLSFLVLFLEDRIATRQVDAHAKQVVKDAVKQQGGVTPRGLSGRFRFWQPNNTNASSGEESSDPEAKDPEAKDPKVEVQPLKPGFFSRVHQKLAGGKAQAERGAVPAQEQPMGVVELASTNTGSAPASSTAGPSTSAITDAENTFSANLRLAESAPSAEAPAALPAPVDL